MSLASVAAVATMRQEIDAQVEVTRDALAPASALLTRLGRELADAGPGGHAASVGIGDSALVGHLTLAAVPEAPPWLRALSAPDVASGRAGGDLRFALCQSISGRTPVTLSAAQRLRAAGVHVVAVTAEAGSPLTDVATTSVVLPIPRFPPGAKVPGTITVTVPLAATVALSAVARGALFGDAVARVLHAVAEGLAAGRAVGLTPAIGTPSAAQIVAPAGDAVAAYLQAKVAETVGVTAAVTDDETWFHVLRHAVRPGSLVFDLGSREGAAIADQTRQRGGLVVALDYEGQPLRGLALAQLVALRLLETGERAPFGLERLSAADVRDPRHRDVPATITEPP